MEEKQTRLEQARDWYLDAVDAIPADNWKGATLCAGCKVPFALLRRTLRVLVASPSVTTSLRPSPLRSPVVIAEGLAATG